MIALPLPDGVGQHLSPERRDLEPFAGRRLDAEPRLAGVAEIKQEVLSAPGRFKVIQENLHAKEVLVGDGERRRRYVLCYNPKEAERQQRLRAQRIEELEAQLARHPDHNANAQWAIELLASGRYKRYLTTTEKGRIRIDRAAIREAQRYDGKWVLRTDMDDLATEDVALRYKELWMVEDCIRSIKSILDTRPIYHHHDETIRGHVFCSFLALVLLKELQHRLEARGWRVEWKRLRDDLDELQELNLPLGEKTFVIRTPPVGEAGHAIQAVGAALGPSVRRID